MIKGIYVVKSPLFILKNKSGDKWYVNWNRIRELQWRSYNSYKKKYAELVRPLIEAANIPKGMSAASITFTMYPPNRTRRDIGNVCGAVEKFFVDVLVEDGYLVDDNFNHIGEINFYFGCVDKDDPRVEIIIKDLSNEDCKITSN